MIEFEVVDEVVMIESEVVIRHVRSSVYVISNLKGMRHT